MIKNPTANDEVLVYNNNGNLVAGVVKHIHRKSDGTLRYKVYFKKRAPALINSHGTYFKWAKQGDLHSPYIHIDIDDLIKI